MRDSAGLLVLVFAFALSSCQDVDRMEKPEDLIPPEKMEDFLLELSLLQAAKSADRRMLEETGIRPTSYLWEKFDIDSAQFVNSNNYYAENYDEYRKIYQGVQKRLEILKATHDSLLEREQRIQDSIAALDPEDSLERIKEQQFRDSILEIRKEAGELLPQPIMAGDTIVE